MKVKDRLTSVASGVDDQTVAARLQAFRGGDFDRQTVQTAHESLVLSDRLRQVDEMSPR